MVLPYVVVAFAAVFVPPGESAKLGQPKPVVLAKGDGFIVHGLGAQAAFLILTGWQPATAGTILHTSLPSGDLKILVQSGTTIGIPVPMGINRIPITQTRIAGVAADDERLYVLIWSARWTVLDGGGTGAQVRAPASDTYKLKVFWLADGLEIGDYGLVGEKRPKRVPPERFEQDPLEMKSGGVAVYGESFRFKEKERLK